MNLLERISLDRAARKYAKRLPAELHRCWGAGETYTPGQIKTAIAALKLPKRWAALGFASFLSEADFAAASQIFPTDLNYETARALFERHRVGPASAAYVFANNDGSAPVIM